MKIRKNDIVVIISGKDKGKQGKVEKTISSDEKVVVVGVNIVKRHVKPGKVSKEGGIISMERPISVSKVMIFCKTCNKGVKVGFKTVDEKKVRVCKKCGNSL